MTDSAPPVSSWAQFERRIRRRGGPLLADLDRFPDAILVAGCQRSGTTALARLLRTAGGLAEFRFTRDDELDAALILSGAVEYRTPDRACFQTTYLNDSWPEYLDHDDFRLIWVLRQPQAVVRSMLRNWKRGALNRLFRHCGAAELDESGARRYRRFGDFAFSRLTKACLSYNAKLGQLNDLVRGLPKDRLIVLDYDSMVAKRETAVPALLRALQLGDDERHRELAGLLHQRSLSKSQDLREVEKATIDELCLPAYDKALRHLSGGICS